MGTSKKLDESDPFDPDEITRCIEGGFRKAANKLGPIMKLRDAELHDTKLAEIFAETYRHCFIPSVRDNPDEIFEIRGGKKTGIGPMNRAEKTLRLRAAIGATACLTSIAAYIESLPEAKAAEMPRRDKLLHMMQMRDDALFEALDQNGGLIQGAFRSRGAQSFYFICLRGKLHRRINMLVDAVAKDRGASDSAKADALKTIMRIFEIVPRDNAAAAALAPNRDTRSLHPAAYDRLAAA